jgi:hypothetical protein
VSTPGKGRRALLPAVAAVVLAVLGVVLLQPATPPTAASGQPGSDLAQPVLQGSPEASVPSTSSAAVSPSTEDGGSDEGSHEAPARESGQEPWRPIATGFLTDFGQPGPDWVARITRWTAPALGAQYADVDLSRVPSAAFVSLEVIDAGESLVDVAGTYDDGQVLLVRIENSAQAWQVTRVEPAVSQDG